MRAGFHRFGLFAFVVQRLLQQRGRLRARHHRGRLRNLGRRVRRLRRRPVVQRFGRVRSRIRGRRRRQRRGRGQRGGGSGGGSGGGIATNCAKADGRFRGYAFVKPVTGCAVIPPDGGVLENSFDLTLSPAGALTVTSLGASCTGQQQGCALTIGCVRNNMPGGYDYALVVSQDLQTLTGDVTLALPPNCEKAQGTTFLTRRPDAGTTSTFSYKPSGAASYTTYVSPSADVKLLTASVTSGMTNIEFRQANDAGFSFLIDGASSGVYSSNANVFVYRSSTGSAYSTVGTSGPNSLTLTSVGAVGQPVVGTFAITVKLSGCMSCGETTYEGGFSVLRQ